MSPSTQQRLLAVSLLAGLVLAGCGGSSSDDSPAAAAPAPAPAPAPALAPGSQVPVSATASSAGATAFVRSQLPTSETAEPLTVGDVTLGTSETEEPAPDV
jgi:hypothetical protein